MRVHAMACEALFNTFCFLLLFLPLTLAGYWLVPRRRFRLAWLAGAGFVFYSLWDARFVLLLFATALFDFLIAHGLERSRTRKGRWLFASIAFNLAVLGFFKYAMFTAEAARSLFDLVGAPVELPYFHVVLPVGISFFTFKTMSYTIDVYRGEVRATRDFVKYLAFVSMFPDLVAGPIVRYKQLDAQMDAIPARLAPRAAYAGLALLAIGLFKKVVIADTIARHVDPVWAYPQLLTTGTAWIGALGYALQLYFDFSGYSDMAIGLGALLGFTLPVNFDAPYRALNPSDFWRRWHITLGAFLRDYLYVPLGGNRASPSRVRFNLLIVMVLGGLWHGAAWTFILWGAYHGLLLLAYRETRAWWDAAPRVLQQAFTLFLVVVGWVIFRAPDMGTALAFYHAMFVPLVWGSWSAVGPALLAFAALFAFTSLATSSARLRLEATSRHAVAYGLLLAVALLMIAFGESPFLYYQF